MISRPNERWSRNFAQLTGYSVRIRIVFLTEEHTRQMQDLFFLKIISTNISSFQHIMATHYNCRISKVSTSEYQTTYFWQWKQLAFFYAVWICFHQIFWHAEAREVNSSFYLFYISIFHFYKANDNYFPTIVVLSWNC